jgi:hypothetical protein
LAGSVDGVPVEKPATPLTSTHNASILEFVTSDGVKVMSVCGLV